MFRSRPGLRGVQRGALWVGVSLFPLSLSGGQGQQPLPVAVSVPPQAYLVERIGGERISVRVMIPPGRSPETYEPSPQQIMAMSRARLYVKVGHPDFLFETNHLEPILDRHAEIAVVDMAGGIEKPRVGGSVEERQDQPGETDPHLWVAPRIMAIAAENIARGLVAIDPAWETGYSRNLEGLLREIATLEEEISSALSGLEGRRFLVYHPAWGHFARAYGLEQVAIETGGKEPSPSRLIELVEEARKTNCSAIFVQRGFPDRGARVIAREIGARVVAVDPLAYDWPAALRQAAEAFRDGICGQAF